MKVLTIQVTDSILADRIRQVMYEKEKKYNELSSGIPIKKQ